MQFNWTSRDDVYNLSSRKLMKTIEFYYCQKGTFPTCTYVINVPNIIVLYFVGIRSEEELISPRRLHELFRGLK